MFDDIIQSAKQNSQSDSTENSEQKILSVETSTSIAAEVEEIDSSNVRINVVGVGGAGCNSVDRLMKHGIKSARTIAINTDGKHLKFVQAHKKVLIGKTITRGLGAGGYMEVARKCA